MSALGDGLLGFVQGAAAGAEGYIAEERKAASEMQREERLAALRQRYAKELADYKMSLDVSLQDRQNALDIGKHTSLLGKAGEVLDERGGYGSVSVGGASISRPNPDASQAGRMNDATRKRFIKLAASKLGLIDESDEILGDQTSLSDRAEEALLRAGEYELYSALTAADESTAQRIIASLGETTTGAGGGDALIQYQSLMEKASAAAKAGRKEEARKYYDEAQKLIGQ